MGFFDRFRGKKKTQEAETVKQETVDTPVESAKPAQEIPAQAAKAAAPAAGQVPDAQALRGLTARLLPPDLLTADAHRKMLQEITAAVGLDAMADFEEEINLLWAPTAQADPSQSAAKLAAALSVRLKAIANDVDFSQTEPQKLLRSWPALDLYARALPEKEAAPILAVRDQIRDALLSRKILMVRASTEMEKLQAQCAKLEREKAAPEAIREVQVKIWQELLRQEEVLVPFDEDHNATFPFIAVDGTVPVFLSPERANQMRATAADAGDGHFSLRKVPKDKMPGFFAGLRMTGIPVIRIFTLGGVSALPFQMVAPLPAKVMIDVANRSIRGLALRTMQYNARANKLNASLRGTPKQKQLAAAVLTMRANLLRELGNGLVYVLGPAPYTPGVTLYTPDALAHAKELLATTKLPEEALVAPGDRSIAAYEGKLALRAMSAPGQSGTDLSKACVCAFTQRDVCEAARKHFAAGGAEDSVVVVTWDELAGQAESCAGVLLDPAALGMVIPTAWFPEVEKFRQYKTPIVVNLQDKKPPENGTHNA